MAGRRNDRDPLREAAQNEMRLLAETEAKAEESRRAEDEEERVRLRTEVRDP